MSDILQKASEQRADLPSFGPVGTPLTQLLPLAQAEAAKRMAKYVGDFQYSPEQADTVMHRVRTWADQHRDQLSRILQNPQSDELPDNLQLALGIEEMQQFVVALYSMATRTMGPWASGLVPRLVAAGALHEPSMREDAQSRLNVFSLIVKWDDEGDLEMIFRPEAVSERLAGLGQMHPAVVAAIVVGVIIAVAIAAAGIYLAFSSADAIRKSSKLMDALCMAAKEEGDEETVQKCLEYAKMIIEKGLEGSDWIGKVITGATVIGGLYVLSVYGIPASAKGIAKSRAARGTNKLVET